MSYSPLATMYILSPNTYGKRAGKPTKITIHHMAVVNGSIKAVGNTFAQKSRKACSNYGIDSEGKIACYLDEEYAPMTSSNKANDMLAVTIEVANSKGSPNWEISDKAYISLIELCADICRRNGIASLNWTGKTDGNLTIHKMFSATACPGPYLTNAMPEIAKRVNEKIGVKNERPTPVPSTPVTTTTPSKEFKVKVTAKVLNIRASYTTNSKVVGTIKDNGVYTIVETQGNWGKLKSGAGWIYLTGYTKRV